MKEQTNELIEQRKEIKLQGSRTDVQNELIGLGLTADFRDRLKIGLENATIPDLDFWVHDEECDVRTGFESALSGGKSALATAPNPSVIAAIAGLAQFSQIADKVTSALFHLLEDDNHSVRLGALLALDRADRLFDGHIVSLEGVYVGNLNIRNRINLNVTNSLIKSIRCPDCIVTLNDSIASISQVEYLSAHNSTAVTDGYIISGQDSFRDRSNLTLPYINRLKLSNVSGQSLFIGFFNLNDAYYYQTETNKQVDLTHLNSVIVREGEFIATPATCSDFIKFASRLEWLQS
ncbi:HEAT repeat domain-containing protein [Lentilitoribacter sp. EG35]|uniref:HEAT repeat domain-containing protein n=1 Tax=Lentilitoribacter sp. EG35 TaxID=3234192 RepID=UPI003461718A